MERLDPRPDLQQKILRLREKNLVNPYGAKIVGGLFSGGVDTSFVPLILNRFFGIEVQSLTLDFGGVTGSKVADDVVGIRQNLETFGVSKPKFRDMRVELGEAFIPMLMGNIVVPGSDGIFPNSSLSRILMVRALAEEIPTADVYVTGSAKNQNNNLRFMTAAYEYLGGKPLWSPIFFWEEHFSRQDCLDVIRLATGKDLSTRSQKDDPSASGDETFLKKEEEDGSRSRLSYDFPVNLPNLAPTTIKIRFDRGRPVAIGGKEMSFVDLVGNLNQVGLEYGIPWNMSVESRPTGLGEPEWNLVPGATALRIAAMKLRASSVPPAHILEMEKRAPEIAELIVRGGFHNPIVQQHLSTVQRLCRNMSGLVELTFYPGFSRASRPQPDRPVTVAEAPTGRMPVPDNALDSVHALIGTDNVVPQAFDKAAKDK